MTIEGGLTADYVRGTWDPAELPGIYQELGCAADNCTSHFQEFTQHATWFCNGSANVFEGGNWIGHVFPGTLFIIWSAHWLLSFVRQYYEQLLNSEPYTSRTCFRVLWFPKHWPLESAIKVSLPPLCMLLELWLAHKGGYRRLICGGEARAGHMIGNHINNWQHAAMYPGFIISGMVELLSLKVALPQGLSQAVLAVGFVCEALLMGLHKKHAPRDVMVHALLFYGMMSSAIFSGLEAGWPHNPLLTAGRIAGTALQGAWFIATARILYEGKDAWDVTGGDMAPVMYMPILFLILALVMIVVITLAFLVGFFIYRPPRPPVTSTTLARREGAMGLPDRPQPEFQ